MNKAITHFALVLPGKGSTAPNKLGEFHRVGKFDAHLYLGTVFPVEEYNEIVPGIVERYKTYVARAPQAVMLTAEEAESGIAIRIDTKYVQRRRSVPIALAKPVEVPAEEEKANEAKAEPLEDTPSVEDAEETAPSGGDRLPPTEAEEEESPPPAKPPKAKKAPAKKTASKG